MSQCDIQATSYLRKNSAKKPYATEFSEDLDKTNAASTIADDDDHDSDMRISQSLGDFFEMDESENQMEDDTDDSENDEDNDDSTQLSINHTNPTKRKKSNKKKGKLQQLIK